MRDLIKEFVQLCAKQLPLAEPIVEFGSLQVRGQVGYADLRPLFPAKCYLGADVREGPGVDVHLDLHKITLDDASVGTVLVMETLEHVEFPRQAMAEVFRILKPQGTLVLSTCFAFPIHEHPKDYWRFSPQGVESLLQAYPWSLVESVGSPKMPHAIVGIALKMRPDPAVAQSLRPAVTAWKRRWETAPPRRGKR